MAEAVAAFYAVETAVEGAALGALAVARSTAPLHLRFRKIAPPASGVSLARAGHTLHILRGKAYIIGGKGAQSVGQESQNAIVSLTLPVASSVDGEGDLTPRDYQNIIPQVRDATRPLAEKPTDEAGSDSSIFARTGHSTSAIDDNLYVWGGVSHENHELTAQDFVVFDTLTNTYHVLTADASKCVDGVPPAREYHTATATQSPRPGSIAGGPKIDAYGTIFIHGGRNGETTLRDTWAFDVGERIWTKLPDLPDPGPAEVAGDGNMVYNNGRLWRIGDGFGRVLYLDLDEPQQSDPQTTADTASSSFSSAVKASGQWQVISFGTEASEPQATEGDTPKHSGASTDVAQLPMPRSGASLVPITTGAGRQYLIYFMGTVGKSGDVNDFWSFQIDSTGSTAASVKDRIRDALGQKTNESWASGNHTWARCEVAKQDGKGDVEEDVDWPNGLRDFGSDVWHDQGGNTFVIWGGIRGYDTEDVPVEQGWAVQLG